MIATADVEEWSRDSWAIVLAGGGGSRLRGCTVDSTGQHVPKQYCVVDGKHTLLQLAIARAERLVAPEHVVVVVSDQHRKWWEPQLAGLVAAKNVVAQPLSRGTAVGVLLPLLHVLGRQPEARVVLLPADHYFRREERLARAIRVGLNHTHQEPSTLVLVGIKPDTVASDLGYIVPSTTGTTALRPVASFVEKPPAGYARQLIARGALWNTMILVARGQYLLRVIRSRFPHTSDALRVATPGSGCPDCPTRALLAIYPSLTTIDLSRDVLQRADCSMAVVAAAAVGWSELGTPERVVEFWDELRPQIHGTSTGEPAPTRTASSPLRRGMAAAVSEEIRLSPPD
jgi:mannose-1-phosphate guanylyltransferase